MRMAREAEEVVGAAIGPRHVRTFFLRLAWFCGRHYPCTTYRRRGRSSSSPALASAASAASAASPSKPPGGAWPPAEYDGDGDDEALDAEPQLRNWLLHRLGELLGHAEIDVFVSAFLGERRFVGIP